MTGAVAMFLTEGFPSFLSQEYRTYKESFVKRFELTRLPPYLVVHVKVCGVFGEENDNNNMKQ